MPLTPLAFSPTDTALFRSRLTKRKQELTDRLRITKSDPEQALNQEDDGTLRHNDDKILGMPGDSGQKELAAIEAALQRIAEGRFGNCVRCGNAIPAARLDAVPHTPFCQDCAPPS